MVMGQRKKNSLFSIQPHRAHIAHTWVLATLKTQRQIFLGFAAPAYLAPWNEDLGATHPLAAISTFPHDFLAFRAPWFGCHHSTLDDLEA